MGMFISPKTTAMFISKTHHSTQAGIRAAIVSLFAGFIASFGHPASYAAKQFRPASAEEIRKLFDAATAEAPSPIVTHVFKEVRREKQSESEIVTRAKRERAAFKSTPMDGALNAEDDLRKIIERRREEQGKPFLYVEREVWTDDAHRIDQTIHRDPAIAEKLDDVRASIEDKSLTFERTWVVDRTKGPHYHFKINWRLRSSHYDTRRVSVPRPTGYRDATTPNDAIKALIMITLSNGRINSRWRPNERKIRQCAERKLSALAVEFRETDLKGCPTDEYQLMVELDGASGRRPISQIGFERGDYRRILFSRTFNPATGDLVQESFKTKHDDSGFPHHWDSRQKNSKGQWVRRIRTYLSVDLNPQFNREEMFAFNPPMTYAIENRSSGKTVIERYPMLGGRRLGPKNVVWDDPSANPTVSSKRIFFSRLLLVVVFLLPLIVLAANCHKWRT